MPTNKLFAGGLAWATDDHTLRTAFERFGNVADARVITDRETGRSRGFGFVTFEDAADAEGAMRAMDGAQLDGRTIRVNEANERGRGGQNRSRHGDQRTRSYSSDTEVVRRGDGGRGGQRTPRKPRGGNGGRW